MCVDAGKECMWQSEDNLRKSVLSFSHVGPVDGPQVGRLGGRNPYLRTHPGPSSPSVLLRKDRLKDCTTLSKYCGPFLVAFWILVEKKAIYQLYWATSYIGSTL